MSAYDRLAPHLYALALRITGDERAACDAVAEAFLALGDQADEASLVLVTRQGALARAGRAEVVAGDAPPTPRQLVEAVFYGGQRVSDLSQAFALSDDIVRAMLRDGMVQLRRQFADRT